MGERPAPVPGVDPLFTEEDAIEILDRLEDEQLLCPGCGQPRVDSMAPENEFAYHASTMACFACTAKSKAMKRHKDIAGIYPFVEPLS